MKKIVKTVGKKFVEKMQEKNIFQDIRAIMDTIIRIHLFPQIGEFFAGGPLVDYLVNTGINLLVFAKDELLV